MKLTFRRTVFPQVMELWHQIVGIAESIALTDELILSFGNLIPMPFIQYKPLMQW
jgi:hypothetical protein